MVLSSPGRRCANRASEWVAGCIFFGIAVWTLIWPGAFSQGRFAPINDILVGPWLTLAFGSIGVSRLLALYCNGNCPFYGPVIRMLGALAGAALFGQMALALWFNHQATGVAASPGIVVYVCLMLGEGFSAYRAAGDARRKS